MENYFYHLTKEFDIQYKKRDFEYSMSTLHYHNSYELYFLEEGSRDILINDKVFHVNQYDIMLYKPNTFHRSSGGTTHSRTVIYFTMEYLEQYFTKETVGIILECFEADVISVSKDSFKLLKEYLIKIEEYKKQQSPNRIFVPLFHIFSILNDNKVQYVPNITLKTSYSNNIVPILSYIMEHFKQIRNITEIAEHFYITKYHLCRIFKESTGITITQYINGRKIQLACEYLKKTEDSITEIGFLCGFNSTMYFCKTFKSITSMTPTDYRQRIHKV